MSAGTWLPEAEEEPCTCELSQGRDAGWRVGGAGPAGVGESGIKWRSSSEAQKFLLGLGDLHVQYCYKYWGRRVEWEDSEGKGEGDHCWGGSCIPRRWVGIGWEGYGGDEKSLGAAGMIRVRREYLTREAAVRTLGEARTCLWGGKVFVGNGASGGRAGVGEEGLPLRVGLDRRV